MPGRLAEKVCVVTGTGGSMGRATALTFAREGALVVGCDVAVEPADETVELVKAAGGVIYWYFNEVGNHTDQVGVADREKQAAAAALAGAR